MKTLLVTGLFLLGVVGPTAFGGEHDFHDDFQSGEAGAKLGTAIFNNTIGKDNPIPDTPSFEERLREKVREAGREAGQKMHGTSGTTSNAPQADDAQTSTERLP